MRDAAGPRTPTVKLMGASSRERSIATTVPLASPVLSAETADPRRYPPVPSCPTVKGIHTSVAGEPEACGDEEAIGELEGQLYRQGEQRGGHGALQDLGAVRHA